MVPTWYRTLRSLKRIHGANTHGRWHRIKPAQIESFTSYFGGRERIVQKIRVLVANRPRLMRELVLATIADQADIEIVGDAENDQEITELVDRTRPDFLIIALEDPEERPEICGFLLGRYPAMRILAVASGQRDSTYFWAFVDIRSRAVQTSEDGILGAVRNRTELVRI